MTDITYSRFIDPPLTPATRRYWGKRLPNSLQRKRSEREKAPPVQHDQPEPSAPPITPTTGLEAPPIVITWEPRRIMVAGIIDECARFARVSVREMKSLRRARTIVRPRQAAMYLAHKHTGRSLPEIGRMLGGRDHSTVLHAKRKVQDDLDAGGEIFRSIVDHVERELGVA